MFCLHNNDCLVIPYDYINIKAYLLQNKYLYCKDIVIL